MGKIPFKKNEVGEAILQIGYNRNRPYDDLVPEK